MDGIERTELKEVLRTMQDLSRRYNFEIALQTIRADTALRRLTSTADLGFYNDVNENRSAARFGSSAKKWY